MIYGEAFDYLFNSLAGGGVDRNAIKRRKDYNRKRLCRAMACRALKPYALEVTWSNTLGTSGEETTASSQPVTKPLILTGGAIRTTDVTATGSPSNNNFRVLLFRTGGNSRVQVMRDYIKDEHVFSPAQLGIRPVIVDTILGQGNTFSNEWPVPLGLFPNELLQIRATVLPGGLPAGNTTFVQFQAVMPDNKPLEDNTEAQLRDWIDQNPTQRPVYLSMFSDGAHSISFPATGANQHTEAKTREREEWILITGYSTLFARATAGQNGAACNPKWRLQSSTGWAYSEREIDVNCYEYSAPGCFYRNFPCPILLPAGASLNASFSTLSAITTALEQTENYVIFRGVTV